MAIRYSNSNYSGSRNSESALPVKEKDDCRHTLLLLSTGSKSVTSWSQGRMQLTASFVLGHNKLRQSSLNNMVDLTAVVDTHTHTYTHTHTCILAVKADRTANIGAD